MPKKILIVDDEDQITKLLQTFFNMKVNANKERIYEVHVFSGGTACINFLKDNQDIEFILTDVRMPNGEGPEILKYLNSVGSSVPLFFMTGFSGDTNADQLVKMGAKKVFAKPFKCGQVVLEIEKLIAA